MKFSAAAVLALLGVSAEAKSIRTKQVLDKRALLSKAIPVDKNGNRRLQQNEWEITGEYSIQFNHCLSLKTQAQDEEAMFGDDTIALTQNGLIVSQASYVLFNVCLTGSTCYYEDDENLYMADLASYMESLMTIKYDDKQNYCNACLEAEEYCNPQQDYDNAQGDYNGNQEGDQQDGEQEGDQQEGEQENGDGENGEGENEGENNEEGDNGDGERRRRKLQNGVNVEYIDCDQCDAYDCFQDEEAEQYDNQQNAYNGQQVGEEDVVAWVQEMAGCQALANGNWNGNEVYASFMCNDDGSGVEIGVFLDNACSVYTSLLSYSNLMAGSYEYSNYAYASGDIVTYPFLNDIDCSQVEYANPYEQNDDQQQEQDNGEAPEASEYCRGVMENSVDLDSCAAGGEEQQEEQQDEEENYYDWYTYDLSAEDAEDIQAVCYVVQLYSGEYTNAHTYKSADGEGGGSGSVYDYKSGLKNDDGMKAGAIFGIVIAVVVVIVAAIMIMQSCSGKRDSKKVPLVNKSGGAMA